MKRRRQTLFIDAGICSSDSRKITERKSDHETTEKRENIKPKSNS